MLRIRPFAALRPRPDLAAHVASVPYDVVDRAQARALCADNPLSFLHVVRPDADLPDEVDPHADEVYARAQRAFSQLQADGTLLREASPKLYLYRQQMLLRGERVSQIGVVACCHIDDYRNNIIKRHEKTRTDKEDDRTRHVLAVRANTGPVFLAYPKEVEIDALIERDRARGPLYDFEADDGVRHTVWATEDAEPYIRAFGRVPAAYVADGHHRSASAARAGAELRAKDPDASGDEAYNWYLCVLFASDQLHVLPYNRLVRDLNGLTPETFLSRVAEVGEVTPCAEPEPPGPGCFGMYLDGRWHRVTLPEQNIDRSDPVQNLDYVLLYDRVLAPILGVGDVRTDTRIDFVGGIHGPKGLTQRVDSGEWAVAFAMPAVTVEQLMQVADAGQIMPPKSTWFEPKLRSGLLIHSLE